jgi:TPR repeat protein
MPTQSGFHVEIVHPLYLAMNKSSIRLLSLAALAGAIVFGGFKYRAHLEYVAMHTMPPGLYEFKVTDPPPTCGRWKDHMPRQRDPEAYRLYIKARNFWRSKVEFEFTREELLGILADVKLAADKGDWGARALLAHFYLTGLGPLDTNMVLDSEPEKGVQIIRQAVAAGQAWGHYDLGVAHEHGYGGAAKDEAISWAYYRRAAELGSPDAQMALADAYEEAGQKDVAQTLRLCAYKQGHGPAATLLGGIAETSGEFAAALRYYQDGARFGDKDSARDLMVFFLNDEWNFYSADQLARLRELELQPDSERKNRYKEIKRALELNPDLRLARLDKVLPLPPAELPPWKGVEEAIEPEADGPPSY